MSADHAPPQLTRPLRILAVTNLWPEGGSFRGVFVREQVEWLRQAGHHVDVEVIAQSRGRADYLLAGRRVARRAHLGGYHLVHVHYGLTTLASRAVTGVPRVLSLYGSDINTAWQRRVTTFGVGSVTAKIYPSRRLATAAGDRCGHIVPNGVDFALFQPMDRVAARASLGIDPDELVVLFGAAPSNPVKGYDVFTDVLAAVRDGGMPVRELILAAPGQPREDVVTKYAAADVLLLTSRQGTESGPLVVKEAAVMGTPVVSVDVGDVAEVLDGVSPSIVVPWPEPGGSPGRGELVTRLAGAVTEILAQPGVRSNGRARCSWLDSARVTKKLIDVYHQVLSAPGCLAA